MLSWIAAVLLLAAFGCSSQPGDGEPKAPAPYNVLFIAIDDLRPELGAYGASHMVTPNLDRFASTARLFVAASHPEVVNELLAQIEANQPLY